MTFKEIEEKEGDGIRRDIAANIKRLRQEHGWTQVDLAREAGISVDTVRSYEGGRTSPSALSLIALMKAFGCGSDEIIGETSDKTDGNRNG